MKRNPWLKCLSVILIPISLTAIAPLQAYPEDLLYVAQIKAEYDTYMRLGYVATAKRDYQNALDNFRKALDTRPGNLYAINAISNVSNYIARRGQSRVAYITPNRGAPGSRQGGATRGSCSSSTQALTALVPVTNRGMTTAQRPAFFFYLPQTSADAIEFALLDENDNPIYRKNLKPAKTPGIVSLNLSSLPDAPSLEVGENYHWYLSIICNPEDRSADIFVDGWIQRIEPDPVLKEELQKATLDERVSLYAVNAVWYDTLAALSQKRQSNPNDAIVANEWSDLLASVGLEELAREPIVNCCTVGN